MKTNTDYGKAHYDFGETILSFQATTKKLAYAMDNDNYGATNSHLTSLSRQLRNLRYKAIDAEKADRAFHADEAKEMNKREEQERKISKVNEPVIHRFFAKDRYNGFNRDWYRINDIMETYHFITRLKYNTLNDFIWQVQDAFNNLTEFDIPETETECAKEAIDKEKKYLRQQLSKRTKIKENPLKAALKRRMKRLKLVQEELQREALGAELEMNK